MFLSIRTFWVLVIVSDFELRISDFLSENLVFVQAICVHLCSSVVQFLLDIIIRINDKEKF